MQTMVKLYMYILVSRAGLELTAKCPDISCRLAQKYVHIKNKNMSEL